MKPVPRRRIEFVSTADILYRLIRMENSPWATYNHGAPITEEQVADLLRPFGVQPKLALIAGYTVWGYLRSELEPVWEKYLGPEGSCNRSDGP
jgi:hypothetical protein